MNRLDQTIEDLEFCIETLGMNDEQVEEFMDITGQIGVRPEYFSNEFIFLTGRGLEEDGKLHDPDYLNIAVFNSMFF
tara:strand:- start:50 stop:280 length:231 start_codon:yes stop_codon:yes gene_type:complete